MSDKSPLFLSCMELIAHATELYTSAKPRNYKFVILHLANSIELILKDRLVDKGISIYSSKQRSMTIGIWDAFEELNKVGINIQERPVIELLIDDRNTIQHRFGFTNAETVYFYLEYVVAFLKRFLNDEYGLNLVDVLSSHLSNEDLAILGLSEKKSEEESAIDRLFLISPESAIMQVFNLIENRFVKLLGADANTSNGLISFRQRANIPDLMHKLSKDGYLNHDSFIKLKELRVLRNRAVHSADFINDENSPDWATGITLARNILSGLDRAIEDGFGLSYKDNESIELSSIDRNSESKKDIMS
ncbi:hypothetical protein PseudUWO310_04645 [Pseudanabaena sp. UWO310]|nr:hypothetical protein PseudUWO310_04645 [Pseudanabaena sp. UWO310]